MRSLVLLAAVMVAGLHVTDAHAQRTGGCPGGTGGGSVTGLSGAGTSMLLPQTTTTGGTTINQTLPSPNLQQVQLAYQYQLQRAYLEQETQLAKAYLEQERTAAAKKEQARQDRISAKLERKASDKARRLAAKQATDSRGGINGQLASRK